MKNTLFKEGGRGMSGFITSTEKQSVLFFLRSLDVVIRATRATYKAPNRRAAKDV